jgi:lipoprotein-releasing system ATP-binding protein
MYIIQKTQNIFSSLHEAKMDAVVIQNLYKIYKESSVETVALRGANLTVAPAEFISITGRSGAGKSTLLNLLGGLAIPSAGQVIIDGADITRLSENERSAFRRTHIGIVYQMDNLIPFLSALENVMLPMQAAGCKNPKNHSLQILEEVGLKDRVHHRPAQLSGGERQRVAIAVALANEPSILLADELTGELDSATADRVMDLLNLLNTNHKLTMLVVTHNKSVASCAQRQIKIVDGQLQDCEATHV